MIGKCLEKSKVDKFDAINIQKQGMVYENVAMGHL